MANTPNKPMTGALQPLSSHIPDKDCSLMHKSIEGVPLEYPAVQNIFKFATDTGYIIDTITPILNLIL